MLKVSFGKTINTDAIINNDGIIEAQKDALNGILEIVESDSCSIVYNMGKKDIVYGLGENVGGINKRGGVYESFCTDDFNHTPEKKSLYASHNLVIIQGQKLFALFVDHPGKVTFDIGFTEKNTFQIKVENPNFDLYYIDGINLTDIVKTFRKAIGNSYIPPKWAFGFQQSRWSYPDNKSIENIANKFLDLNIPCDAIYLDIDYMENYKNFTIDDTKFPEFTSFVKKMKNKGFRLIPIIDAGCKIEEGYNVHTEGIEKNYYCVNKNGQPFVGAVWPGLVHFPDFLNPETRIWFGDKYNFLIDKGIEGFWNDMNEPAIFYSETGIKDAYKKLDEVKGQNLDINSFFDLKNTFNKISNSINDYKSFYHQVDGQLINHYDVHNLYGFNMTKAASEGFSRNYPNKRFLLFSRASSVGMHRFGGIWTGDNKSWWEHLLLNIKMMPSLNMLGFLYSGADIGGFGADANAELNIRWTQFGIFTPLLRNHSALGTRSQEGFSYDNETTDIIRNFINLRYALIPYLYSEFMKAVNNSDLYIAPLSFEYSDEISCRIEDQLLVGESIMIAPIYNPNQFARNVWLPEEMLLWNVSMYNNLDCSIVPKGHSFINVELDQTPVFIKKDKILIIGNHGQNVESIINKRIKILAFIESEANYSLYDDDGITNNFTSGSYSELNISIKKNSSNNIDICTSVKGEMEIEIIEYSVYFSNGLRLDGIHNI